MIGPTLVHSLASLTRSPQQRNAPNLLTNSIVNNQTGEGAIRVIGNMAARDTWSYICHAPGGSSPGNIGAECSVQIEQPSVSSVIAINDSCISIAWAHEVPVPASLLLGYDIGMSLVGRSSEGRVFKEGITASARSYTLCTDLGGQDDSQCEE